MLFYTDEGELTPVLNIQYAEECDSMMDQLPEAERDQIMAALTSRFKGAAEVRLQDFVPQSKWEGTPYEPLWRLCRGDGKQAALLLGLTVQRMLISDSAKWSYPNEISLDMEVQDKDIGYLTYTRII